MGRKQVTHTYNDIISVQNLLAAWREFVKGKRKKKDVQEFAYCLMDNIFALHADLVAGTYMHGSYHFFRINDPKQRDIHKASVRDRLVHHALHRVLYPHFDHTFVADSFSCRKNKGTHKALLRFTKFARSVSVNNTRTCWVLKCDIRKFFASVDHTVLLTIVKMYISDPQTLDLLSRVVTSFRIDATGKGLPLGNLTSQLLVNIYMNEFDQFVKHTLKVKHYIRYADDFVLLHHDKKYLIDILPKVSVYLSRVLMLELHPNKIHLATLASGVDFLGWSHFPSHRLLRTTTKRRMIRRLRENKKDNSSLQSYLGLLRWGNTEKLQVRISTYIR